MKSVTYVLLVVKTYTQWHGLPQSKKDVDSFLTYNRPLGVDI